MKNADLWRESKFVRSGPRWVASRDPSEVSPQSRLAADLAVSSYANFLERYARGRLLDHGCGKAPLYGIYRSLADEVVTVDWTQSAHWTAHADVVADLNQPMPFADASFDTVISSDVVEHLWNPVGAMHELSRVLADHGILILGTPFAYWLHEAPHDYFRWTSYAIERLGADAGLEVIELRQCGGFREVLADTLLKAMVGKVRPGFIGMADRMLRLTRFASPDRISTQRTMLGVVAALRRRPRT